MKISYNWLKQFIQTDWSATRTGELLTDLGLEIEGIEAFCSVPGGLEGVVVGKVTECIPHPNADRLKLTKVDIGEAELLQIVCGAPNVDKGQTVPVATIGTTLYDKEGNPWKIKKGKIRGEESQGMICAEDELGLGDSHDGIMVLDEKLKAGTPCSEVFAIENDEVFEIGLTPNRADAMSHWGVARDLRAGLLQQEITKELITPSTTNFKVDNRMLKIEVEVHDNERAPRYCGVTLSGLTVKESPNWLKNRLRAIGLGPINNVVDATNYVLHELGQPLHAFDAGKIKGQNVQVKTLAKGTKFTTLDGVERELHPEDLMICDAEKPMCIAGVFGGLESGVSEETTSIFLESAYFDPVSVRKTAKRHGLNTDASFRFERGIDPNITEYALMRAAILIQELAGGEITSDIVDIYPKKIEDHQVVLNFEDTNRLIGQEIPRETIKQILTSLDIKVNNVTETGIGLTIPAYRNDVIRQADVIEEVLRVYGYNNIDFSTKLNATVSGLDRHDDHYIGQRVADKLTALGFYEIMSNSLTAAKYAEAYPDVDGAKPVALLNPLSQDLGIMRQEMLFGALEALVYNRNRKQERVRMFEFGKTYSVSEGERTEEKHLALLAFGPLSGLSWSQPDRQADFYYMKGVVTATLSTLGIAAWDEKDTENTQLSDGLDLLIKGKKVASFGLLDHTIAKDFDLDGSVVYADLNWDLILKLAPRTEKKVKPIPKYPEVRRDLALLLDEHVRFDALQQAAMKTERKLLRSVELFDVYTGKSLPAGTKSYALSFVLRDEQRTLTDKQIDKVMQRLQQVFEKDFGAQLR